MLKKLFGSSNDRVIKRMGSTINAVAEHEPKLQKLSDDELARKTIEFKERLTNGENLDSLLPEAFAVVREASVRTLGMRHFDVQIVGGIVLHSGQIAEMRTGEGKTLAATLPAYLNGLAGSVHVVTVNDYLARRDAEWMGKVYNFLGLSVGCVFSGMEHVDKKIAYNADITYGQNNEFGFDYLRDNMKYSMEQKMQRGHDYAIVDEVDSILIDEARTPLIISGPAEDSSETYLIVDKITPYLKEDEHYEVDLKTKNPTLNEDGVKKAEELLSVDNLYNPENIELLHHVNQSLKAHTCLIKDVDYVVKNKQIVIVDEFTGRLMPGRRWSDGLHQAIEAKEKLPIARENQTLASITFQNLFRLYGKLSGMTGTAATESAEFKEIYGLDVVVIPTNKPLIRDDQSDVIFRNVEEKYENLAEDIAEITQSGQPILVGTISIEQSEAISKLLNKKGIEHNILNAKQHEREANIVTQAGRLGSITIATNMAGRGTDIVLGGNPEGLAIEEFGSKDPENSEYQKILANYQESCAKEKLKVLEAGGLCILGTERHESRRIDNQLRGRAGRQGDPGLSRFYVSLKDDLMKRFGGERIEHIMSKIGWQEGHAIDGKMISKSIEGAQKKVERFHFESRKHVTEYDDVMNKQRKVIYELRNKVLKKEDINEEIKSYIEDLIEDTITAICDERQKAINWDIEKINKRIEFLFNIKDVISDGIQLDKQIIFDTIREAAKKQYEFKTKETQEILDSLKESYLNDESLKVSITERGDKAFDFEFATIEQDTILESLDHFWNLHLKNMDSLREGIGLRSYGQKNPLHEYQREGFTLFSSMLDTMKESIVRRLFFYDANELQKVLEHYEAERQRRAAREKQMEMEHRSSLENEATPEPKNPNTEKEKLAAQKKARRKKRKK